MGHKSVLRMETAKVEMTKGQPAEMETGKPVSLGHVVSAGRAMSTPQAAEIHCGLSRAAPTPGHNLHEPGATLKRSTLR